MKKLIILFLFTCFHNSLNAQWSWLHPNPQGNTINRMSFINATTGWAAGEKGAIIKTANGGSTWSVQYAGTIKDFRGLAFTDVNNGWAGAGSELFYTANSGQTWDIVFRFPGLTITAIAMQDKDTGLIAATSVSTGSTIYRTTNGGLNWTPLPLVISTDINDISYLPNGSVVAAGTTGTLLHSVNGGISWTTVNAGTADDFLDISAKSTGTVYATTANGIYKSNNGGTNYLDIGNPGGGSGLLLTAIDFANANDGVAACDQGNIYITNDGGQSWNYYGTSTYWLNLRAVEAINSNIIYTGGTGGTLLNTVDGGTTWNELSARLTEFQLNAAEVVNTSIYFAVGQSGTLLKTSNGGASWTPLNSGAGGEDLHDVHFINSNVGICIGSNGTIVKTTDGGNNWNFVFTGIAENLFALSRSANGTYYAAGADGKLVFSTNNGDTWSDLSTAFSGGGYDFTSVQSFGNDSLVIATNQPYIISSYDNGATWNLIGNGSSFQTTAMWFNNAMNGWVGNSNGEVYATTDGGNTWTLAFQSMNSLPIGAITFTDPVNGWIASGNELYRTGDGGNVWGAEICPSQDAILDLEVIQGVDVIGVGAGLGTIIKRSNEITLSLPTSVLCTDNTYTLAINATGTWNPGNVFYIELSDDLGAFNFPAELGSVASTGTTPVLINVTNGLLDGTSYRIRVFSSNPPMWSKLNSLPLEVRTSPEAYILPNGPTAFCQGSSVTLFAPTDPNWTYTWFKDGVLISGQTADSLVATQTGDYTVNISDGVCSMTSPITDVLVINCTGIAENANARFYRLQPNPATDFIQIRSANDYRINTITILDVAGRVLDRINVRTPQQLQIPVDQLQPGMYQLWIDGEKPATLKFIKR